MVLAPGSFIPIYILPISLEFMMQQIITEWGSLIGSKMQTSSSFSPVILRAKLVLSSRIWVDGSSKEQTSTKCFDIFVWIFIPRLKLYLSINYCSFIPIYLRPMLNTHATRFPGIVAVSSLAYLKVGKIWTPFWQTVVLLRIFVLSKIFSPGSFKVPQILSLETFNDFLRWHDRFFFSASCYDPFSTTLCSRGDQMVLFKKKMIENSNDLL